MYTRADEKFPQTFTKDPITFKQIICTALRFSGRVSVFMKGFRKKAGKSKQNWKNRVFSHKNDYNV